MSSEPWARVSLKIVCSSLSASDVDRLVGIKSSAAPDKPWAMDLTDDSGIALSEQLATAKDMLHDKVEILEGMSSSEISLYIGWTPQAPQDGIILDAELIALLNRIRCSVLLDTYVD